MTVRAAAPRWRVTWALRENDRRQRAFDSEAEAWHRRNDHLIRLQIEAAGFHGYPQPHNSLPVDLGRDEVVYWVLPAAELVEAEARHIAGLPAPELAVTAPGVDTPGRGLPMGLRVVDAGMAAVTNHRIVFSGREGRREWTYPDMVGPAHHPDASLTLLHTTDGSRLAGLRVPATATVNFRFYLTLAFAAATGQRAAIAAQIDALLDGHQKARPTPPPPAHPDHAPLTALRPDRLAATAAALVALTFATLAAGTSPTKQAGPPYRADAGTGVTAVTTDAPDAIGATAPSTPTRPAAPDSGTAASLTGPTATPPTSGTPTVDGPTPRQHRTSGSAPSAVTPAGRAARPAPPAVPAPTTTPPPTTGPSPSPSPTTAPPPPESPVVNLCLEPLRLPLAERLLCPPTSP
ncbi:hypothetical protein [Micromonospora sp. NPDC050200]|uniref:hypothetical protein n=1 Tax=Micromonospora sp. NPDC050200 TaxID=3155664 RepID=UPI0033CDBD72